jgi:hypothetical protein
MLWNSFAICRVARWGGKQWETKTKVLDLSYVERGLRI